jgi:hypothetical protein
MLRRKLAVFLGLVATSSAVGAIVGALSLWVATAIFGVGPQFGDAVLLDAGAKAGALTGIVLAPISAWSLLRKVPLWRTIGESALGALLGSLVGSALAMTFSGGLAWSILGGPVGFALAVIRLRMASGTPSSPEASVMAR